MMQQNPTMYEKFIGTRDGIYYIGLGVPNRAEYVYYADRKNKSGFGGATLRFPLEDGTVDEVVGPWHGNADSLFAAGGPDLREMYFTRVVVADEIKGFGLYEFKGIHHYEAEPVLGSYERGDAIAKEIARRLGRMVYRYSESRGGSSLGGVAP